MSVYQEVHLVDEGVVPDGWAIGRRALRPPHDRVPPTTDRALQTVGLVDAARELGVDGVELMKMIAKGDVRTTAGRFENGEPVEEVGRLELDRVLAQRGRRDREAHELLNPPARPFAASTVQPDAGEEDREAADELARLMGEDPEQTLAAKRRQR